MRRVAGLLLTGALACAPSAPLAFGTIHGAGQDAEHERITRRALSCTGGMGGNACFEPAALDLLAGRRFSFGAVGAPDDPRRGLFTTAAAHCDGGDHLERPGYPRTRAQANEALVACRAFMETALDAAVTAAGGMLDENGRLDEGQVDGDCEFTLDGESGARCEVLARLGLVLHAAQDFYSHTNWTDRPAPGPVSTANPPGLANTGPAPWIAFHGDVAFPSGLISGCFQAVPEALFCRGRVRHADLNKDGGVIQPHLGEGRTPRGRVNGNFARAVEAAVADTADKWRLLRERLEERFGRERGARLSCALRSARPLETCR